MVAGNCFALDPSGAGKTIAIEMLTTLLPPTSGQAIVDGFQREQKVGEYCAERYIIIGGPGFTLVSYRRVRLFSG